MKPFISTKYRAGFVLIKIIFSSLKMSKEKLEADKHGDLASIEELTDSLTYAFDEDRYFFFFCNRFITK